MSNYIPETRICKTCQIEYPLTTEFFIPSKKYTHGMLPQCRKCVNARTRKHYQENAEEMRHRNRNKYAKNKEHYRKKAKEWRLSNPEKVRESKRLYRKSNLESIKQWQRLWRERNPNYGRDYYYRNLERSRSISRRFRSVYRARSKNAEGRFTIADVKKIYNEQDGKCEYCKKELHKKFHVDHIMPLSRGGTNYPSNICCACRYCNQSKKDKTVKEWELVRGW